MNIPYVLKLTLLEIKNIYSQNVLGIIWFLFNPFLFFSAFYFFSICLMGNSGQNLSRLDSFLFITVNLSSFFLFSNALTTSCGNFSSCLELFRTTAYDPVSFILKYTIIPALTYVPIILISCSVKFIDLDILLSIKLILNIFLICILESAFVFSLSLILSCFVALAKDTLNVIQLAILCLMFVSPLGFRAERLYEISHVLYYSNPLIYFLNPLQKIFLVHETPSLLYLAILAGSISLFLWLSIKIFKTFKMVIVDYV